MTLEDQIEQAAAVVRESIWRKQVYDQQKNLSAKQQEAHLRKKANLCRTLMRSLNEMDGATRNRLEEQQKKRQEEAKGTNRKVVLFDTAYHDVLDTVDRMAAILESYKGVNDTRENLPSAVAARHLAAICEAHRLKVSPNSAEVLRITNLIRAKSGLESSARTVIEKARQLSSTQKS